MQDAAGAEAALDTLLADSGRCGNPDRTTDEKLPDEYDPLIRKLVRRLLAVSGRVKEQKAVKHRVTDRLKQYIDQEAFNPEFSVARTAEHFGMARSSVSTLFRRQCGTAICRYVGSLRVEEAKRLLGLGLSVNEVTLRIGYHDTTSFIKKFKKLTGITPGEYTESPARSEG